MLNNVLVGLIVLNVLTMAIVLHKVHQIGQRADAGFAALESCGEWLWHVS